jgi:hypothetical protein
MLTEPVLRPPTLARILVRVASWIVPARARPQWRARWDTALWNWWILFERGELTRRDRIDLISYSWGSFTDALHARISPEQMRHSIRSPGFVLATACAVLAVIGIFTQGYSATRALFRPYPIADPASLVSIAYTGSANQPSGLPPRFVAFWRANSSTLTGLAAYAHLPYAEQASVTLDFFSLMGTRAGAGRLFQPGDRDVAVLSAATWRTVYGADHRVIGTPIAVRGGEYTIVGVLPDSFWAISPYIGVFTPLILEPQPSRDLPFLIGAVGRLKPGTNRVKLRADLFREARAAHWFLPRPPEVTAFTQIPDRPLFVYLFGVAFAVAIGIFMVARQQPFSMRHGWRYWSFLASKTMLLLAIPVLLWIESEALWQARGPHGTVAIVVTQVLITLFFLAASATALWWSFADQRRRCPECLQMLAMPVTLGSWSSVLDPATTEFLCESGHGSLYVPETEIGERDRWTSLDPSWRELFHDR